MNLARLDEILARHDAVPARLNAVPGQAKKHEGGELSFVEGAPTGYDSRLDAVLSGVRRFEQHLTLVDAAYNASRLDDAEWDEQAHPRKATGQFAPKGQGGSVSSKPKPLKAEMAPWDDFGAMIMAENKYDPARKFTWNEGDLQVLKEGDGDPILSQEELDRILRENNSPEAKIDAVLERSQKIAEG